jgi:hypothetical protein
MREIEFERQDWDPNSSESSGPFTPALLAFVGDVQPTADDVSRALVASIRKLGKTASATLEEARGVEIAGYSLPTAIDTFLSSCAPAIVDIVTALEQNVRSAVEVLAILGVAYVFVAMGAYGNAVKNAETMFSEALELLDEAFQAVTSADFGQALSTIVVETIKSIKHFNLFALTAEISIERAAYFAGGLVGFLVQIVAGLFWSGGVASVEAVALQIEQVFGSVGAKMAAFFQQEAKAALVATFEFTLDAMISLVRKLLALIKKGKAAVEDAVRAFFAALKEAAKLGDDVVQMIKQWLGLTDAEMSLLDELGLEFVQITDDAARACLITY